MLHTVGGEMDYRSHKCTDMMANELCVFNNSLYIFMYLQRTFVFL